MSRIMRAINVQKLQKKGEIGRERQKKLLKGKDKERLGSDGEIMAQNGNKANQMRKQGSILARKSIVDNIAIIQGLIPEKKGNL